MYRLIKNISNEEWLAERAKGIGSSEVGTILGVDENRTLLELWKQKTGRAPRTPMNEAMCLGHALEAGVARMFEYNSGATIIQNSDGDWLAVDTRKPFLRVSPDRLYWAMGDPHSPRFRRICECKTTCKYIDPENPPLKWVYQLTYQMGVMGISAGAIAWISSSGGRMHSDYTNIPFVKDTYEKEIVPRLEHFWKENIIKDIEPTAATARDLCLAFPKADPAKTITATAKELEAYNEYTRLSLEQKELKERIKQLEEKQSEFSFTIREAMKDSSKLISPEGKLLATWNNGKDSEKFDLEKFKSEQEMLYKEYTFIKPGERSLRIK